MSKIKEKKNKPHPIFGNVSSRESKKRWMEITRQATEDQEKIIRQAEVMDAKKLKQASG